MFKEQSDPTTTAPPGLAGSARVLLALATACLGMALLAALAPAGLADTATPINGSIHLTVLPVDANNPTGPTVVYAQGQWNWSTHNNDCNTDRAGAGLSMIWNDPNEPGYPISGQDVNHHPITFAVGVKQKLNGDTYNSIDGTVHPADIGIQGGANAPRPGAAGQAFSDPAPAPSGGSQDVAHFRGGCGREPLTASPYPGHPYGSWGYNPAINGGMGYSHVYMHRSDVTTVCVNMYDVHGGGNPGSKNFQVPAGNDEIDAAKSGDNTIKASQFDPTGLNCVTPGPDVMITATDGGGSVVPGGTTTYTIVVTNLGPGTATSQSVTDHFPGAVSSDTWTATTSPGATVSSSTGNGDIGATVTLPSGGSVTFTVTAQVSPSASGSFSDTASAGAPGGDPNLDNNTATDTDTLTAPQADLAITKDDGVASVNAGSSTTYTIVVTNTGPSTGSAQVADTLPAAVTSDSWTAVATPGATVADASGSGNVAEAVTVTPGSNVTFTVVAQVSSTASGNLSNTASVTATGGTTDPFTGNNSATDNDTINPSGSDLSITMTDGAPTIDLSVKDTTTYTIVVTNSGPLDAPAEPVTDAEPSNTATMSWTAAVAGGASVDTSSGTGSVSAQVTVPVGGSVTFTVTVTGVYDDGSLHLVNTATVGLPPGDQTPANNGATDSDFLIGF